MRARAIMWWLLRQSRTLRSGKRWVKKSFLQRPRRIPRKLGVEGLFRALNSRGCRYVVLRWFEELPELDPEGDLDILIADEDAGFLDGLLTRSARKGDAKCDVYSVSGLPKFSYRRYAYYPPGLAVSILEGAVEHPSGAKVPCREDYFFSLAFHALYHKGYGSGIPVGEGQGPRKLSTRHDYAQVLGALAKELEIVVPIHMEALDRELDARGWRPPPDTLMKWAQHNSWCRDLVEGMFNDAAKVEGLMLCLIRDAAADLETVRETEHAMDDWGFIRLATRFLDPEEKDRATRLVRGGNWGRGPWPKSGGPPGAVIAAVDPTPAAPSPKLLSRHPGADNARVFEFKGQIRDRWNQAKPARHRANIMHTSDNAAHAMHYLESIMPDQVAAVLQRTQDFWTVASASSEAQASEELNRDPANIEIGRG